MPAGKLADVSSRHRPLADPQHGSELIGGDVFQLGKARHVSRQRSTTAIGVPDPPVRATAFLHQGYRFVIDHGSAAVNDLLVRRLKFPTQFAAQQVDGKGFAGISAAAGTIFFSFIGLDAVATAGEEVKNPQKALPRAIIGSLLIGALRGDGLPFEVIPPLCRNRRPRQRQRRLRAASA